MLLLLVVESTRRAPRPVDTGCLLLSVGRWLGPVREAMPPPEGHRPLGRHQGAADGPIDAVYTWVNGSDEAWLREMLHWKRKLGLEDQAQNITQVASSNRYRENDELRFSLRSVHAYAPWIRHIFIVTNGQVPSWLNASHPGVSVVTHAQIFRRRADLPTFSSNAIEANLHCIPGLAARWIYFNDDVFLAQPVFPSDWAILSSPERTTYKLYLTWPIPTCAEGCTESWIGDGTCDPACNVTACGFDGGDCHGQPPRRWGLQQCSQVCLDELIGNGICDAECDNDECGMDGGECAGAANLQEAYGFTLDALEEGEGGAGEDVKDAREEVEEGGDEGEGVGGGHLHGDITASLMVPSDISAMYLDTGAASMGRVTSVAFDPGFVLAVNTPEEFPTRIFLVLSQPRREQSTLLRIKTAEGSAALAVELVNEDPDWDVVGRGEWDEDYYEDGEEEAEGQPRHGRQRGAVDGVEVEEGEVWGGWDEEEGEGEGEWSARRALLRRRLPPRRRLLMDTFGNQLRWVDKLLQARYGPRPRRVLAHMPHMIETGIMAEVQEVWGAEYAATSSNRFRSGEEMQMSFAYYSYLAEETADVEAQDIVATADINGDARISRGELLGLSLVASKHGSSRPSRDGARGLVWPLVDAHSHALRDGGPGISYAQVLAHMPLVEALQASAARRLRGRKYRTVEADESLSRFIMLQNNITETILELDNARADRDSYLFLCLNDNLDEAEADILPVLREVRSLLGDLFPTPSPFELEHAGGRAWPAAGAAARPEVCGPWCARLLIAGNVAFLLWLLRLATARPARRPGVRRRLFSAAL
eukprot:jgi/Tetstr1/458742/TSEL_045129.t1